MLQPLKKLEKDQKGQARWNPLFNVQDSVLSPQRQTHVSVTDLYSEVMIISGGKATDSQLVRK